MESSSQPDPPSTLLQAVGGAYILFGSFGLVGMISTCGLYFTPLEAQSGLMPEMLRNNATFAATMRVLFFPGLLLALLQFGSGIGLLRASPLARKVAIGCALYGILAGLFSTWLTLTYTLPFTLTYTLQQVKNPAMIETTRDMTLASSYFSIALGLLYPVVAFVLLKRAKIRSYRSTPSC